MARDGPVTGRSGRFAERGKAPLAGLPRAALLGEPASLDHDVANAVRMAQRMAGTIAQSDIAAARQAAARFSLF